jgi:hypothetical protein
MCFFGGSIFNFFSIKDSFKKRRCAIERIFRKLGSFDCQEQFTNSVVENMWPKHLTLLLCPKLNFPSKRQFSQEILPRLIEKKNQQYVILTLANFSFAIVSFDLWMSKGAFDVFALGINFLSSDW